MVDILYEGDGKFQKLLNELSCPMSLREIKALMNGFIAAPSTAMPSVLISAVFKDEEPEFNSLEHTQEFMSNIMGLWNVIAHSHGYGLYYENEEVNYPTTPEGLTKRLKDSKGEILAFIEGLDLGETDPEMMPENGKEAFNRIVEAEGFLEKYLELLDEKELTEEEVNAICEELDKFDDMVLHCKNMVIKYLLEIRKEMMRELKNAPVRSDKIGRNEPCPCGSGKKYKKCCLLKIN